ncbi:hypothetical protein [Glycomyces sp. YM15]|uniref:hypothetical protein n=1 Tax=Glycomyces sp. YM15 TaxID=2800446 RepID=UPI0019622F01|nr:hypothetical protein [Glycomyces sp. YM15]
MDADTIGKFASLNPVLESLEAGQPERHLGTLRPSSAVLLTLHATGPETAVIRRHRSSERGPDVAAALSHSAGHITAFEWDQWHKKHRHDDGDSEKGGAGAWMDRAEAWAAETIAAHWTGQAR